MPDRKPHGDRSTVAFLLTQVGSRAAQEFGKRLEPLGFAPPDAGILRLLSRSPGISQQELARRLDMHASRLVAIIDALEKRGLVERKPNPDDRRLHSLELTAAGNEALVTIGRASMAHDEAICAALGSAEKAQLGELLRKLANGLGLTPGIHPGYRRLGEQKTEKPRE